MTTCFAFTNPPARLLRWTLLLCCSLMVATPVLSQVSALGCGSLNNTFGPFDYRPDKYKAAPGDNEPHAEKLRLVHIAHFRPEMEALIRGGQGVRSEVGPEFDYTLRAFPNHHRALVALIRLAEKQNSLQPRGMRYSVECWFERALRFMPDDTIARMIYVSFLIKQNRTADAKAQLDIAERTAEDNPLTQYNIGMMHFELKNYDKALLQAHKAYAAGVLMPDLKIRLEGAGQWKEAAAPVSAESASSPKGPQ
ncbi:MAG: ABC transporter permease [Rhizobacter sp.]